MLTGYDARSIRTFTKVLKAGAVVEIFPVRLPDGTDRLHYEPGQALLAAVEQFDAQYFDDRSPPAIAPRREAARDRGVRLAKLPILAHAGETQGRTRKRADSERRARPCEQMEIASGGRAVVVSGELPDPKELNSSSSFSRVEPENFGRKESQQLKPSEVDCEVAVEALAKLRVRRFGRGGKLFDATVVSMAAACVSMIEGDRDTKMLAQLDAIEEAFRVSLGTPTPTYIWGSLDHFLQHEASGRKSRLECDRVHARRAHEAQVERERAREWSRREREACGPPPETLKLMAELGCGRHS